MLIVRFTRHNGVIIEPVETSKGQEDGDEAGSSASKDGSRSTSPSTKAKGKGKTKKHDPDAPTALANPGTAGPASGPSSYYRQHTMQNGTYRLRIPHPSSHQRSCYPTEGVIMDTTQQYAQNGGASAARLHQASWPPPPPWAAEGSQAQMGTISYHPSQPGYYQPSPYYRQNGPPMSGVPVMQPTFASQPQDMHQAPTAAQVAQHTPGADMGNDEDAQGDVEMVDDPNVQDAQPGPIAPVIDPSLDMSVSTVSAQGGNGNVAGGNLHAGQALTPGGSSTKPVSLEITQAAMEAVLQSSRTSGTPDRGAHSTSSSANGHLGAPSTMGGGLGGDETQAPRTITTAKSPFAHQSPVVQAQVLPHTQTMPAAPQSQSQSQVHGLAAPSAVQPELMESILNAAGEPMLTPGSSNLHPA